MTQVLEQERKVPAGYEDIVLYDDYGNRVTNLDTLKAIREGQKFFALWEKMIEEKEEDDGEAVGQEEIC